MKFYDRVMTDASIWKSADWYDSLSEQDRSNVDMSIAYGRDDDWRQLYDAQKMSMIRQRMQASVIVDASNVAVYCNSHGFDPHAVPAYKPPFDSMWFETSKPYADPHDMGWGDPAYQQVGAHLWMSDEGDEDYSCYGWFVFVREAGRVIVHPAWTDWMDSMMPLDSKGQWIGHSESSHGYYHHSVQSAAVRDIAPFLMAIGFTHCKNVELVEGQQAEGALRKKQEKKLGRPLTAFRELVIDPNATQRRYESGAERMSRQRTMSRHIVRGHFATYTEDRPRFGREKDGVGAFWIQPHLRGSDSVGRTYKDYAVKAPK